MKIRNVLLGSAVAGLGAAAITAYAVTRPKGDVGPFDPSRRVEPIDDALLDMPSDVIVHDLPTPDGGIVHAVERGSGRPLVLLHGITLRHDVWAPQFNELADRYRVIAADLRGHGESKAGTDGYGLQPLGHDLAVLLDGLDLHDAIVVGHSMGGMTLMTFCGDHPDVLEARVAGLVFVATAAHRLVPAALDRPARVLIGRGQHRVDAGRSLPKHTEISEQAARLAFGERPSKRAVSIVSEMGRSMEPAALLPSLSKLLDLDARAALRATHTPSLVVVGTRDLLTPVWAARHLARQLPDAELVVLGRAGHQLMQERPVELAELIDAFAARVGGDAATVAEAVAADPRPVEADQVEAHP